METIFTLIKTPSFLIILLLPLIFLNTESGFASLNSGTGETQDLFPEIDGWGIPEKIQTYTPDILYEYIDGAAELYLIYGFRELWVAEYTNEDDAYIIVEVYFHHTPEQAFGIYSQERPEKDYYIDIGAQGYLIPPILNFLSGNAYVKINSTSLKEKNKEILLTFAEKLASNLHTNKSLPPVLDFFPRKNKKEHSEKFIPSDFLGYEFLHYAFTADYADNNTGFTLFIIQGQDDAECQEMLTQYLQFTKYTQKKSGQHFYILPDPYHGEIALLSKGRYIWGVVGLDDVEKRKEYLLQIGANISAVKPELLDQVR